MAKEKTDNLFEKACLEWLRGCTCADREEPQQCEECTNAFLTHIKNLGKDYVIDHCWGIEGAPWQNLKKTPTE